MCAVALSPAAFINPLPVLTVAEQVRSIEEDGRESLYVCPDAWALRHRFVERETGQMIRARCDSWRCLHCAPRKVDLWRQLVKAAEPTLFVTLTKAGWTVEEAARVLTTVLQRLRRGYRSKDPTRKGYREAYPIEYFAVLERHKDFAKNGFHWHLLVKGVDYLPKQAVSDALYSATKRRPEEQRAYIVDVQRVKNATAVGYVTKYLTKSITNGEQGVKREQREMIEVELEAIETYPVVTYDEHGNEVTEERPYAFKSRFDEQGRPIKKRRLIEVEVKSKARRIRYSRRFFPESVAALREKLFTARKETEAMSVDGEDAQQETEEQEEPPTSSWTLVEAEPLTRNAQVYAWRKRAALHEVLTERRARGVRLSRRLVTMWYYQRCQRDESKAQA